MRFPALPKHEHAASASGLVGDFSRAATNASALLLAVAAEPTRAAETVPLTLEAKISLGEVSGRIDHLAFDPTRERLYVAELGNNSVGIVDLKSQFPDGYPAEDKQQTALSTRCVQAANDYTGNYDLTKNKLGLTWDNIKQESWNLGSTTVNCKIGQKLEDGSGLQSITNSVTGVGGGAAASTTTSTSSPPAGG